MLHLPGCGNREGGTISHDGGGALTPPIGGSANTGNARPRPPRPVFASESAKSKNIFILSDLTTRQGRGGARRGSGRKPKPLLELAEKGTFSVTRHGRLLWTDDSLIDAAAERPDDEWLQRLAKIVHVARTRGAGRHDVTWFARTVREWAEERDATLAKPHSIEVVDDWVDGERVITTTNPGQPDPVMMVKITGLGAQLAHFVPSRSRHEGGGAAPATHRAPSRASPAGRPAVLELKAEPGRF